MPERMKAIAFDMDAASLSRLKEALPGWQIDDVYGATVASLPCYWNPGAVDLADAGIVAQPAANGFSGARIVDVDHVQPVAI